MDYAHAEESGEGRAGGSEAQEVDAATRAMEQMSLSKSKNKEKDKNEDDDEESIMRVVGI